MSKSSTQKKSDTAVVEAVTFSEHVSAVKRTHGLVKSSRDTTGRRMVDAGLALIGALESGAVTFDRVTGKEAAAVRAAGVMTKSDLQKHLSTSGTMLTKYRNVGLIVRAGVTPDTHKADWTMLTEAAASKWVSDAAATGDAKVIDKAIADHRPGASKGDQKNGQTAKKATKKATPAATKTEPANVTKATLEQDVARVVAYLTANNGKRLDTVSAETLSTIHALLIEGAESVEAATHRKATAGSKDAATILAAAV